MQTHSDMCVHSRVPEQQSEAFTYRPANRTGCGGSRVDDFHVLITWKTFMSFRLVTACSQRSLEETACLKALFLALYRSRHVAVTSYVRWARGTSSSGTGDALEADWPWVCTGPVPAGTCLAPWRGSAGLPSYSPASFYTPGTSEQTHPRDSELPPGLPPFTRGGVHAPCKVDLASLLFVFRIIYPETVVIQWHVSPKAAKVPDTVPLSQHQNRGHSWSLANWDRTIIGKLKSTILLNNSMVK